MFAWVKTYGGKIFGQMRRMGISVDWDRLAFTMDDNLVGAVQEAFVRLHQEGLIYRENRLVNWCCTLHTAVSDIEVGRLRPPPPLPALPYTPLLQCCCVLMTPSWTNWCPRVLIKQHDWTLSVRRSCPYLQWKADIAWLSCCAAAATVS